MVNLCYRSGIGCLIGLVLFSASSLTAGEGNKPFYTTSQMALHKADSLFELNEYALAVNVLKEVSENDTSYATCEYKRAYAFYLDSNYAQCEIICRKEISKASSLEIDFYNLLGLSHYKREEYQASVDAYKEAISKYPTYYLYYYNKGNSLKGLKQYDKALASYKRSIVLNPFYLYNYFQLGYLMGSSRNTTAAAMAYHMYLMISPTSEDAGRVIGLLEKVIKNEQDWERLDVGRENFPEYFEEIDIILDNKIALNEAYKLKTDLDYHLFRQSQALLEKIPANEKDTSFWHQHLGKMLGMIWTSKNFPNYAYYMLQGVNNESLEPVLKKKASDIDKFRTYAEDAIVTEMKQKLVKENKSFSVIKSLYYGNNVLYGRGPFDTKAQLDQGQWTYYFSNCHVKSRGAYDEKGKRNGLWEFFYLDGVKSESSTYVNGTFNGPVLKYHENGALKHDYSCDKEGKIEGKVLIYSEMGCLVEEMNFKAGLREGESKMFYEEGNLKSIATYKQDKKVGFYFKLYESGDTLEVGFLAESQYYNGPFRSYYDGNKLYAQGKYVEGDRDAYWNYYYRNGNKLKEGAYKKDKTIGLWKEYYEDGTLKSERSLDESGKQNGEEKFFDHDGKLFEMYTYKTGVIMGYKYFDTEGKMVDSYEKKSNELDFKAYNRLGRVVVEGRFVRDGRDGDWKFYNPHGLLDQEAQYKDGETIGQMITYHENGEIKYINTYEADVKNGLYESRDSYGHLLAKGYYLNGMIEGEFFEFNADGDTIIKKYFKNGNLDGRIYYYSSSGKLEYVNTYKDNYLIKSEAYDLEGKVIATSEVEKGNGTIKYYHPNGKLDADYNFVCGQLSGHTVYTNGVGEKTREGGFDVGNKEGEWKWYNYLGGLSTVGSYVKDEKHGRWLSYFEDGKIHTVEHYEYGEKVGVDSNFHENGVLYTTELHRDGKRHGEAIYRNLKGQVYLVKEFFEGEVIACYMLHGDKVTGRTELVKGNAKVVTTYANGKKAFAGSYKNGLFDGELIVYHEDGKIWKKMRFNQGHLEGEYLENHLNGLKYEVWQYRFGDLHGLYAQYDEKGNKMKEINYLYDDKNGEAKYYINGKLDKRVEYFENDIITVY